MPFPIFFQREVSKIKAWKNANYLVTVVYLSAFGTIDISVY